MIFVFAPAEAEDQDIIGGQQKIFFAGGHVEHVQCVRYCPSRHEEIEPPAVGAELLTFKIAELMLGTAAAALQEQPVIAAVDIDAS